jgi:hypothetical protein
MKSEFAKNSGMFLVGRSADESCKSCIALSREALLSVQNPRSP